MAGTWQFDNCILQVEVGSTAHGTGLEGVEDYDNIAIVLEPPVFRLGFGRFETTVYRPGRAADEKSGPGDWDLTIHSLHKWLALAIKGNPSILMALWAPVLASSFIGDELRSHADWFIGRHLVEPFLGYAQAQRQKLTGERGGRHGQNRPALVEQYGYDTKYAMHMLRLGFQGREVIETGRIAYPARQRDLLLEVRRGKHSLDDVLNMARVNENQLTALRQVRHLPATANTDAIEGWLVGTYREWYETQSSRFVVPIRDPMDGI